MELATMPRRGLILVLALAMALLVGCLPAAAASGEGLSAEPEPTSILKSSGINGQTFQRTQSKREATAKASPALISATTQMTQANGGASQMGSPTAIGNTIAAALDAPAPAATNDVTINNISDNGSKQATAVAAAPAPAAAPATMATVSAALEANLIMSNRNIQQQQLPENNYRITHGDHNATSMAVANATTEPATTTTTTPTTTTTTTTTRRTTRRPVATTTLKPPPTIDDYQTIISQAGTHAYLPCNVKQLVKKPISWLRMRDGHILTVDQTTFIADQRFQSVFSPNPERWSLQIKYVQVKDEGTYECQVSTEPKASAIVHLRIVEPKTELIGESTRHVKAGSQVKLRCIISQALEPPLFINWFYNQKQIYLHNRRGWRTEIERIDLPPEVATTTTTTTSTTTTTAPTTTTTTAMAAAATATGVATSSESVNGLGTITRSYILDAISLNDVGDGPGAVSEMTTAPGVADRGFDIATSLAATPTIAAASASASAATTQDGVASTAEATTTTTWLPSTETATTAEEAAAAATTTTTTTMMTTTMLPSSSFIKQITTASLIIPAVVKLDSGNYTCSPSNSAPRTIVLHVLNGEYSASAIKSGSVSWRVLIGCRGCYLHWRNVSTLLTLLWIIKFVLANNKATATPRTPRTPIVSCLRSSSGGRTLVCRSISGTKVAEDKT